MAQPPKINPAQQVDQAKKFLLEFYEKPIAQVSTELFFTIAATIFFAIFAIRPTIITMTELVKEIEDKKRAATQLKNKVATLSTVQNEFFSLQDQFYVLEEAVPTTISFEKILPVIEKTASDLQISITSMQILDVPLTPLEELPFKEKVPGVINMTVTISGSYSQIRDFISELGKLRPILTIDSVAVTSGSQEEVQDFLSATIRIQAHYFGKEQIKKENKPEQQQEELNI